MTIEKAKLVRDAVENYEDFGRILRILKGDCKVRIHFENKPRGLEPQLEESFTADEALKKILLQYFKEGLQNLEKGITNI